MPEQYQRFLEVRQEPIRLSIALDRFFAETDARRKDAYGQYLKRRVRPAMERLLSEEDFEKLERLDGLGWIGPKELDDLLQTAREKQMLAGLVWLLQKKQARCGFQDRDFSL